VPGRIALPRREFSAQRRQALPLGIGLKGPEQRLTFVNSRSFLLHPK
jgi:hypothetical protein